ncbi:hypothetical protein ACFP7A_01285 [Sporolactobacillus kofuensis]|uniref:DUF3006 domain-containing protein n=1 Tax=Sporolactobacillus kofuensis TaxID=269672 RepID=A0ABW1WDH1_9BACL|nr:hypothetical protein [Sporolactobacillus kofuensis]MCO7177030.1 hypothetical protein [Sporolactobacillus kofuensis]
MKIENDPFNMVGRTITFIDAGKYADQITIATDDGHIMMAEFDYDELEDEDPTIHVLNKYNVLQRLSRSTNSRLVERMKKEGFDLREFEEREKKLRDERMKKLEIDKEKQERMQYERLKAKYEGK